MKTQTHSRQLQDAQEMSAELAAMCDELVHREPDAVLILAKCGNDLVIRVAGNPRDVLRLYAETTEIVRTTVRQMIATASGLNNG